MTAAALGLQRTVGNAMTGRLLAGALVQPKLTLNRPGDRHEQEADRVAEEVLRMPQSPSQETTTVTGQSPPATVRPVCSKREEELQRQPAEEREEEEAIRAKTELGSRQDLDIPATERKTRSSIVGRLAAGAPDKRWSSSCHRSAAAGPSHWERTMVRRNFRLSVAIPRVDHASPAMRRPAEAERTRDSSQRGEGDEEIPQGDDIDAVEMAVPDEVPTPEKEPEQGESVELPDITFGKLGEVEEYDPVFATAPYIPSIAQGGATPPGFGVTRAYTFHLGKPYITNLQTGWLATVNLENPIQYQVRASTGPSGQTNITSATDPALTAGNYADAVSSLTPDMSNLNGKPPRKHFWSKPLTERHELFHCRDGIGHASRGVVNAHKWLLSQTASTAAEVVALLAQVPQRVIAARKAGMTKPGREERAYSDGAPAYRTLADTIKAKGDGGDYP